MSTEDAAMAKKIALESVIAMINKDIHEACAQGKTWCYSLRPEFSLKKMIREYFTAKGYKVAFHQRSEMKVSW